jgi:hypothetical protein
MAQTGVTLLPSVATDFLISKGLMTNRTAKTSPDSMSEAPKLEARMPTEKPPGTLHFKT